MRNEQKIKVLLIVLLVGVVCLVVCGCKRPSKKETNHSRRIKLLEDRVTNLEHAIATKLTYKEVIIGMAYADEFEFLELRDVLDDEERRRKEKSTTEIHRAVRSRILEKAKPRRVLKTGVKPH